RSLDGPAAHGFRTRTASVCRRTPGAVDAEGYPRGTGCAHRRLRDHWRGADDVVARIRAAERAGAIPLEEVAVRQAGDMSVARSHMAAHRRLGGISISRQDGRRDHLVVP